MKIKSLPKTEPQIDIRYLQRFGIQSYDTDNLYPQNVMRIVGSSKTGDGCLERYKDFMDGNGIASDYFATLEVNRQGETLADIHGLVSDDLATFNGFALHLNYNEDAQIVSIHSIPFENVRLCEPDEEGVIKQVAIHPDWTGHLTRNGKVVKVDRSNIDFIDVYNPRAEVVRAQIAQCGGITHYKGQVLYVSMAGYLRYPLAMFDSVLTDMSTDEGISNLMLRNARNNFLPVGAFVHFTGQGEPDEDGYVDTSDYSSELKKLQGDTNALNILDIECENRDEIPQFVPFAGKNLDKDFTETDDSAKESIYSKFGQEAYLAVRLGKTGFGASLMQEANDDYARRLVKKQKKITRAYVDILQRWAEPLSEAVTIDALAIMPLTYSIATSEERGIGAIPESVLTDLTINERRELIGFEPVADSEANQQMLASVLGVGGTQSLLAIMQDTTMAKDTKKELLKLLFNFTDDDVNKIVL